jgi:hypothetical protein
MVGHCPKSGQEFDLQGSKTKAIDGIIDHGLYV